MIESSLITQTPVVAEDLVELQDLLQQEDDLQTQREELRKKIGRLLGKIRTSRKKSFREAGKLLECDPGLLNRVEKGNAWAYTIVNKALAKYPEVSIVENNNE